MNALLHHNRYVGMLKLRMLLLLISLTITSSKVFTQCPGPLQAITYDTVFTGSGNGANAFSFPRFNGQAGTLMMVEYNTIVTLNYQFELENRDNRQIDYRVRVNREDEIWSSALQDPLFYSSQRTYGNYRLRRDDGVAGSGDDFIAMGPMFVLDEYSSSSTVYNTADYLGTGDISVDYSSTTYSIVTGSLSHNFNGSASDTVRLSVTYHFCPTQYLASDIINFSAVKKESAIQVKWSMENETGGRTYELQRSTNGHVYTSIKRIEASPLSNLAGKYEYQYLPAAGENGKTIFRVKQIEPDGTVKFSSVRVVDLANKANAGLKFFPNPSNGPMQFVFDRTNRSDWRLEVINMNGYTVEKREFKNAVAGKFNADSRLAKGLYLVKVKNLKSGEQFVERVIIK